MKRYIIRALAKARQAGRVKRAICVGTPDEVMSGAVQLQSLLQQSNDLAHQGRRNPSVLTTHNAV